MTDLTWVGGGNNQASNPNDWSPNQAPQPNDSLSVLGGPFANPDNPGPFTMNVSRNDLAGDFLGLGGSGYNFTANLSHQATMSAGGLGGPASTFNLSQQSTLDLGVSRDENNTINLSGNSTLQLFMDRTSATINISGSDTANIDGGTGNAGALINLAAGAQWSGTFNNTGIDVNGGKGSTFNNNGDSGAEHGIITIDADVVGKGSFSISTRPFDSPTRLEFVKSVGPNQTITDPGLVQIDQPKLFDATVTLTSAASGFPPSEIDLLGLAKADSYTFKNDMLNIFSGTKIIDTLRLHDSTQYGFVVEPPTMGGSVNIVAISDPMNPPAGLPFHTSV